MDRGHFMDKIRTFFGFRTEPPRNDFRNPIWGSDDDDDDGDELYTRHLNVFGADADISRQMHDIFMSFGSIFGEMKSFFNDDAFQMPTTTMDAMSGPDDYSSNSIRDYYLKPGYHNKIKADDHQDVDLDGKISSQEISGLFQKNEPVSQFDSRLVPGHAYCKTIITTSVKKSDGTIETRRIVKNGHDIVEDSTVTGPDTRTPITPGGNKDRT